MFVTWLTQGGFLLEQENTRVVIDPYMSTFLEQHHGLTRLAPFPLTVEQLRPDWVLCTHDHLDHLDPETIQQLAQAYPACRFAGPASCCRHFRELLLSPDRCTQLDLGQTLGCGSISVTAVTAFHSDPEAVGLILDDGETAVYLTGDSTYSPDLINDATRGRDTLLVCINGRLGNMGIDDAVELAKAISPRQAIPMHYGLFAENTEDPTPFIQQCREAGITSFPMTPGVRFPLHPMKPDSDLS